MATVKNMDVAGIISRINLFRTEILASSSALQTSVKNADAVRIDAYLLSIESFRDVIVAGPELDMPRTHPRTHNVVIPDDVGDMENLDLQHMVRLLDGLIVELHGSQSADLSNGVLPADLGRLNSIIIHAQDFMTNFVMVSSNPLDLPETATAG